MIKTINRDDVRKCTVTGKETLVINVASGEEQDGLMTNDGLNIKRDRIPHSSFFKAMRKLLAHAMVIYEYKGGKKEINETYLKAGSIIDDPEYIKYSVTAFELKADGEETSIALTVRKKFSEGGETSFKLPSVKMYQNSKYKFSGNLESDFEDVLYEIEEYIGGKYRESTQYALDLEEGVSVMDSEEF